MESIFSTADLSLVTWRVYSQCLISHWSQAAGGEEQGLNTVLKLVAHFETLQAQAKRAPEGKDSIQRVAVKAEARLARVKQLAERMNTTEHEAFARAQVIG
jgi:hypothetical protein